MFKLSENILDVWLGDYDEFRVTFLKFTQCCVKSVGYYYRFDGKALEVAHANWAAECKLWEQSYVMPSNGLSHLKMMAILLHQLSQVEWLTSLEEFDPELDSGKYEFGGEADDVEPTRADIRGGGGTYLAFEFCVFVINWFEEQRVDRSGEFVFRLTPDMLHDTMVYLRSNRGDAMAVYLIFKALYIRAGKDGNHRSSG